MRRTQKISGVPETLLLMQSLLWYNDQYQIFFSKHKTNNPQEYYCFFLDIKSGVRKHGRYRVTTEYMLVNFFKFEYKVKELTTMRRYDMTMIQLTNIKNELDYINWMGAPLPIEKGLPYTLK